MLEPVEFTVGDARFRHTPLPAIPLAREHDKLLRRLDHESGALNTFAYTLEDKDYAAMASRSPSGIAQLVKMLSMLVGGDGGTTPIDNESEDAPPPDTMPRDIAGLCLYYAGVGKVEQHVEAHGADRWLALQSEDDFNAHPLQVLIYIAAWNVLRGLFAPFAAMLPDLFATAKRESTGDDTSQTAETTTPEAPTSPS